ncbi:MAG TPA: hypothetical protein VF116_20010 [Ktedonobacterales bacterium]
MVRRRDTAAPAADARFCHLCGGALIGRYLVYSSGLVCCAACQQRRPHCARCHVPLDDAAIARAPARPGDPTLCAQCAREARRCACCGTMILDTQWYTLEEGPEGSGPRDFCQRCWQQRPRCDLCRAPCGPGSTRIDDGQYRCAACAARAVTAEAQVRTLYGDAVASFAQISGQRLSRLPRLAIVSRREMAAAHLRYGARDPLAAAATGASTAVPAAGHHVLGYFVRDGAETTIYVERALPRLLLLGTLAHELGHAWQAEHAPSLRDLELCEGFAEWAAHGVLVRAGAVQAAALATRRDDVYGRGLRRFLAAERKGGRAAALALARGQGQS